MVQIQSLAGEVHVATHPTRVRIAQQLASGEVLTIDKLKDKLNLPGELVAFHLAILENHELVNSVVDEGNPTDDPRLDTYFNLTPKYHKLLKDAGSLI